MLPINTILHPTDFSERSNDAFWFASSLAHDHGAKLIVLHVREIPVAVPGEFGQLPIMPDNDEPLRNQLRHVRPAQNTVQVEHYFRLGDPAKEIVGLAAETSCDLIVMGTHGRTGLRRLLMGSVAEQVMRKAPCPVLTLKAPFHRICALAAVPAEAMTPETSSDNRPAPIDDSVELGVGD